MDHTDPLENLGPADTEHDELLPAPEDHGFDFPLVSKRSKDDLEGFGLHIVDDYRDFKCELLSWLATYGKNRKKHEGLGRTTLESTAVLNSDLIG